MKHSQKQKQKSTKNTSKNNSLSNTQRRTSKNNKNALSISNTPNTFINKRIVSPQKLKILVLSGNDIHNDDLQFLSKCINLIKLDLSNNHIFKIFQKFGLQNMSNLRVLMLQNNKLSQLSSITPLLQLFSLQLISYTSNPIQQSSTISHLLINNLINLKIINYRIIFIQQRYSSIIIQRRQQYIQKTFQEWIAIEHTEKYYLKVLELQLTYVDNMWMYYNPIVKIQRIWRAVLDEKKDSNINGLGEKNYLTTTQNNKQCLFNNMLNIDSKLSENRSYSNISADNQKYNAFHIWKQYYLNLKTIKQQLKHTKYSKNNLKKIKQTEPQNNEIILNKKQYLTYPLLDYYLAKRNLKIKQQFQIYLKKIRNKLYIRKMYQTFKRNLKLKIVTFQNPQTSFYTLSGLKQSKKLYFNRSQQHLIENFLAHIAKNFPSYKNFILNKSTFSTANHYVSIRLMDPDTYSSKINYNPFTYLLYPSMRSVILKKKKFPYKLKSSIIKIKSLSYIKNQNKYLKSSQKVKSNQIYLKIDKFFQNQYYQNLGCLECHDQFVMKQLIRMIYYHNNKALKFQKIIERSEMMSLLENYNENVAIYTDKLLERTTAAVKIQQQWRRFINVKRQKQSIYEILKKNRAARLIQKFFRNTVFYHRLNFQKNISLDLTDFNQNIMLIPKKLYENLEQIIQNSQKYLGLYKNIKIQVFNNIAIYHEDFNQKQVFFPILRKIHFNNQNFCWKQPGSKILQQKIDILKILHKNSQVKIVQCENEKFYKFIYQNVQQVKIRTAIIALLTYKLNGSKYLLPLSRNNLHLYNNYVQLYKEYGVICNKISQKFLEKSEHTQMKINVLSDINAKIKSPFIYIDPCYQILFNQQKTQIQSLNIQFYQKKYQDFPQKHDNKMYFVFQKEQAVLNIQKFLIQNQDILQSSQTGKKINFRQTKYQMNIVSPLQNSNIQRNQQDNRIFYDSLGKVGLEFSKTTQKRLSLYAMDVPPIPQNDPKGKTQKQLFQKFTQEEKQQKKQKVTKFLQSQKQKKNFFQQRKQADLALLRQKRRQQKMMNTTLKSLNQSQRTQNLRKKTQKIRQLKQRSLSHKKDEQSSFIQQGNFVMQQHLKMNLMRNKMKQIERLKQKKKSLSQTRDQNSSWHQRTQGSKSFKSIQSKNDKKVFFQDSKVDLLQLKERLVPSANYQKNSLDIFGGETQVVNKKSYVKKRSSKGGAYLRDPSLVHGVFPEQYYPIQSSRGGIVFPKV